MYLSLGNTFTDGGKTVSKAKHLLRRIMASVCLKMWNINNGKPMHRSSLSFRFHFRMTIAIITRFKINTSIVIVYNNFAVGCQTDTQSYLKTDKCYCTKKWTRTMDCFDIFTNMRNGVNLTCPCSYMICVVLFFSII